MRGGHATFAPSPAGGKLRTAISFVVGLGVGAALVLGWGVVSTPPSAPGERASASAAAGPHLAQDAPIRTPGAGPVRPSRRGVKDAGARAAPTPEADKTDVQVDDVRAEVPAAVRVEALAAENRRLRFELANERAMRQETEGRPVSAPPDLPPRFAEAELKARFEDALKAAGLAGEVLALDCAEFPCVVYGGGRTT